MTAHCLAAVAIEPGVTELREVPLPELGATSGLLKVEMTGVCGSDWAYYQNLPRSRGPLIQCGSLRRRRSRASPGRR